MAEEKKELMDVIENASLFRYGTPGVDGFQGKVATFEKEIAEQLGHKYVVATNAGTSSLMACLAALGIGMGDEVIVPGYTFIASISTIAMMNAVPVLAEIDDSLTIDPTKIKEELGWYPETTFEVGIVKTIDWYLNNRTWWENIISGEYRDYYERMYTNR